jgi:hypothetical protein
MAFRAIAAGCLLAMPSATALAQSAIPGSESREKITARPPAEGHLCFDSPRFSEQTRQGRSLAFVQTLLHPRLNDVCTELQGGERITVYVPVGDQYREVFQYGFGDGNVDPTLFTQPVVGGEGQSEVLLAIEQDFHGTGNFREYLLFHLTAGGDLVPVPIRSPASLLAGILHEGQGIAGPALAFEDGKVTFGMQITNGIESIRFPTGGSAFGSMQLVRGAQGLELLPVAESLQMPSESSRHNRLGLAAYRAQHYDEAVAHFRQALHWHQANYEALSNLGLTYLRQNKARDALEVSTRVVEAGDAQPSIRGAAAYNAGRACESLGERERAIEFYRTAVSLQDTAERRAALARVCPAGAQPCT